MSDELHTEDLTILAALEALGKEVDTSGQIVLPGADETSDTLTRLYLETLGLMPYALEPVAPSAGLEESILAAIRGAETLDVADPAASIASVTEPVREPELPTGPVALTPPTPPAAPGAGAPGRPRLVPMLGGRGGSSRRRWPLALAVTLALASAGLAGWLALQWQGSRAEIEGLQAEVDSLRKRVEVADQEVRQAKNDALSLREKFSLVTSPAVEVSPLRPDEASPLQPQANGVIFVAADRQHWYLAMHNLEPAAGQKAYCLWFINDSGPQLGGAFKAAPGGRIELSAEKMPPGTKDVRITLEDSPTVAQPAGQLVLKMTASYQL